MSSRVFKFKDLEKNMRLFIGIEIPLPLKNRIALGLSEFQTEVKGWEKPHDFHITLLYIGETLEESLPEIKNRMNHFHFSTFELETEDLKFFPRRVLYLSFKKSIELLNLKKKIEEKFSDWVKFESKTFVPHVTIKRWQRYEYKELLERIAAHPFPKMELIVDTISLFQSQKNRLNEKYHVIYRSKFK